jgi:Cd2+/Zn2+-exporting ATPase
MNAAQQKARSPLVRQIAFLAGAGALLAAARFSAAPLTAAGSVWLTYALHAAAYLLAGWKVLLSAARGILRGSVFDENFLMTVAPAGAFAIGRLDEAVAVMLFYMVGEILQGMSVRRSRASIRRLLDLRPDFARVRVDGTVREIRPDDVPVGSTFLVRPGERVPLDGTVTAGEGFVDTSALTGEPVPRRVSSGREVLAGFISRDGSLEVCSTRAAGESSAARIAKLVEDAAAARPRTEQFIRKFARVYTPLVVAAAAAVAFVPPLVVPGAALSDWVHRALTMLVISCPCALVISIPLGYFGGVGGASRRGILVKGAAHLDTLARVRTAVFDKTGTLTRGTFSVRSVVPKNGLSADDVLRYAAMAEEHSNHPIAASIRDAWKRSGRDGGAHPSEYAEVGGRGIRAVVEGRHILAGNDALLHESSIEHDTCVVEGTSVQVAVDGRWAGYIVIGDEIRPEARPALETLRSLGVSRTVLLSGDDADVVRAVASRVGISEAHGNLLPEEKVARLEQIVREPGRRGAVAFVGDGINDAPVLARADVGIAMGPAGADAAVETADVVLMSENPGKVAEAISHARRTRAIVLQNIVLALGIKGVFLALGGVGVATMWEAVIADMGVALAAILNAARALR